MKKLTQQNVFDELRKAFDTYYEAQPEELAHKEKHWKGPMRLTDCARPWDRPQTAWAWLYDLPEDIRSWVFIAREKKYQDRDGAWFEFFATLQAMVCDSLPGTHKLQLKDSYWADVHRRIAAGEFAQKVSPKS
jgi:hypothetical protein